MQIPKFNLSGFLLIEHRFSKMCCIQSSKQSDSVLLSNQNKVLTGVL